MTEHKTQQENTLMNAQEQARQRTSIWVALTTGVILLAITLIILPGAIRNGQTLAPVISGLAAIAAFVSALLSARGRYLLGSGSLVIVMLILAFVAALLFSGNQGVSVGLSIFFAISAVAAYTLPPEWAFRTIIAGAIVGTISVLTGLYLPNFGFASDPRYTNAIAAVLAVIYVIVILRQFNQYTLQTKLIILFIFGAIVAVGAISIPTNITARAIITRQVGLTTKRLADRVAVEISDDLEAQLHLLQIESTNFKDAVLLSNSLYPSGQTDAQILEGIKQLDANWIAAADNSDPLIARVLNNSTSIRLRGFQSDIPEHVEIFLTDKYGAIIGSTDRTSSYYQANEYWWLAAYNNGNGAAYIGQPEYDLSSKTYVIKVAVPVYSAGKAVGVLRSTVNVNIFVDLLTQEKFGNTGGVDLRLDDRNLIGNKKLNSAEIPGIDSSTNSYSEVNFLGTPSLVSQVPVLAADPTDAVVSQLGWQVIAHQGFSEAIQPVTDQTKSITLIALLVLFLAAVLGYIASQRIAAPIVKLTETAGKLAGGDLSSRASIQTRDEIGSLANTFNYMADELNRTLTTLEERVAERTTDFEIARQQSEKHAEELQAISEISRIITEEQKLENLLPLITRLVSERFNFYHTGIFFLDENRQFAVLQAANSEGGKRMLERGYRLEIGGSGIVEYVARQGMPRIALDVGQDAVFFNNPDLPDTRSEIALPLSARGQEIGVLDVQSNRPGAFTEYDMNTLNILADQIAIAIDNARLLDQKQQALNEAQAASRQNIQQGWQAFGGEERVIGYQQTLRGGKKLNKPVDAAEIREAMNRGDVIVNQARGTAQEAFVVVPIKLRGQIIGTLKVQAPSSDRLWTKDEINLAEAISERLSLALENARLIQDSQRQVLKERTISEITGRIGSSVNMDNVLQMAVEELGRAIPGSEVLIRFNEE